MDKGDDISGILKRVEMLKQYIFNALLSPLSERITYTLEKGNLECHFRLELPKDFREIERQIGYLCLGINDYVVFWGEEPTFVNIKRVTSDHQNVDHKEYLFIGHDVDGKCYAYSLVNKKATHIVCWYCEEPSELTESILEKFEGTFLDLLEDKIYYYLK